MSELFLNLAHYSFFPVQDVEGTSARFDEILRDHPVVVRGTVLIAKEGINFNLCAAGESSLEADLLALLKELGCQEFDFHKSWSESLTFKRLKIQIRDEIVALKNPGIDVPVSRGRYAKPQEFREIVAEHLRLGEFSPWVLIDTRNDFEFDEGSFEGALRAGTQSFRQFVVATESIPKNKKIAMFCTGGIRCEKASAFMKMQGWSDVVQLEGGILTYFSEVGGDHWRGNCFVFDDRRSVQPPVR